MIIDIMQIIIIVVIILLVVWLIYKFFTEGYKTKREKAEVIGNWFANNKPQLYTEYKQEVPDSDIVEYSKVKELYKNGYTSIDNIVGVL